MLSSDEIKKLRIELSKAMKSDDIVAALESPVLSIETNSSLIHSAAKAGVLTERFLNSMLSTVFRRKDRKHFNKIVNDEALGFSTLRSFWNISSLLRDNDQSLTLEYIINEYRHSDPRSLIRVKWFSIIFGQSYRENNWDFILNWAKVAINEELSIVGKRYFYGAIIGLINNGYKSQAKDLLIRRKPFMSKLDELFFIIPLFKTGLIQSIPSQNQLVCQLHDALPDKGQSWNWFCESYLDKINNINLNLMNVRIDQAEIKKLQQLILKSLKAKRALSFHRMGDGAVYRWPLPEVISSSYKENLFEDDIAREFAWWNRRVSKEFGDKLATLVTSALQDADILGIISAYRLIRDISELEMVGNITGRSLLRHVEALNTLIPLNDKAITEDRVHTIIYTKTFLQELFEYAENIIIVGGLSERQMNLPHHCSTNFIPLIPESNKGLPTCKNARSIIDDFDDIVKDVTALCKPGTLALISGGYAGKALVAVAKESGAVALDIGSLADLLAGYHTRSPADAI